MTERTMLFSVVSTVTAQGVDRYKITLSAIHTSDNADKEVMLSRVLLTVHNLVTDENSQYVIPLNAIGYREVAIFPGYKSKLLTCVKVRNPESYDTTARYNGQMQLISLQVDGYMFDAPLLQDGRNFKNYAVKQVGY